MIGRGTAVPIALLGMWMVIMAPEMKIAGSRALLLDMFLGCKSLQADLLHGRWVSTGSWFSSGLHWFVYAINWVDLRSTGFENLTGTHFWLLDTCFPSFDLLHVTAFLKM